MSRCSYLGMDRMEVFDNELWAIGHALDVTIQQRETLLSHGVKPVAECSTSQIVLRTVPDCHVMSECGSRPNCYQIDCLGCHIMSGEV
jgi:hypothetical protein